MSKRSRRKSKLVHNSKADTRKQVLWGLLAVLFVILVVYVLVNWPRDEVTINQRVISVDVADEAAEHEQGLSGREHLEQDSGMLFVFDEPSIPTFSMRDMKFALDFVWIREDLTIAAITPSIGVDSYPIGFSPEEPIKYVLEVNAGLSAYYGWLPGDQVTLNLR